MRALILPSVLLIAGAACAAESDTSSAAGEAMAMTATTQSVVGSDVSTADRDAIVETVQHLFDALETGDAALLREVLDEDVVMHFWEESADGAVSEGQATVDGLATRITTSDVPLIERMWEPEVRMSGEMASVWTAYDFYAGETFSHCGVDQATLIRSGGSWRVVALSWTRQQPPKCELHPDGPPAG